MLVLRLLNRIVIQSLPLPQISFRNQTRGELIHFGHEYCIEIDIQILGGLDHLVDLLHIFSNRLEGVVMRVRLQKVPDVQLMLESQMHILCLLTQFHIYVNTVALIERLVESGEFFSLDGGGELILVILNLLDNLKSAADRSLLLS